MLNDFTKDSNNSLFGPENRLIYFAGEAPFAGRINAQENFEDGISTDLQNSLDNLNSLSDNTVEAGPNMFHTLVELFNGDRNLAAEVTDALDDDATGFGAQFDRGTAMYSPDQLFDTLSYDSATKTISFIKDGETQYTTEGIDTFRSELYEIAAERIASLTDTNRVSTEARAALATEVQRSADEGTLYQMVGEVEDAEAADEDLQVRRAGATTIAVPTEVARAAIIAQEGPTQTVDAHDAWTNLQAMNIQLTEVSDNLEDYTSFNLPSQFRSQLRPNEFREMISTGRLENSDLIQEYARTLGMGNLNNLLPLINNRRGSIDAGTFLSHTEFASTNRRGRVDNQEGNLEAFTNDTTALFARYGSLSGTERLNLQRRNDVLAALVELVAALKNLRETDETNLSPDYITDVEFSDDLRSQLGLRDGEFRGGKDEFGALAVYTYIYGPVEILSRTNEGITSRTETNGEQTLIITALPPEHLSELQDALTTFDNMERLNIGIRGRRTLTRALEKLRTDNEFHTFRESIYSAELSRDIEANDETSIVETHLGAIFDVQDYGSTLRQHRHTLQAWEAEGDFERGGNETFENGQVSDFAKFSWILNDENIVIHEGGETSYDLEALSSRLKELAENGKTIMFLERDLVDDQELFDRLQNTDTTLSADNLRNPAGLTEDFRRLVRLGALNEGVLQRSLTETMDAAPPQTPLYNDLVVQMVRNGIPEDEIPELITSAENWLARIAQNPDGSIDDLEFGASRTFAMDRNGNFTIAPNGSIEPNGQFALGIRLTANYVNTERTRVYSGAHLGVREETMNPVANMPSVSVTLLGVNQAIGNNDWSMNVNVGGTAGLTGGAPVMFQAGIEFNQSTRALVRREYAQDGSMGDVAFDTIERVRDGHPLSDKEVEQFLVDLGADHALNQALENAGPNRDSYARTYVEMLAEAEMMDSLRDASGATFGIGGGFPSILYIKINFLGREKTFYRIDSVTETRGRVSASVYRDLAQNEMQRNPSGSFTVTTTSGEISYDGQTGRLESTMGISIESDPELTADTTAVAALNAGEDTHGLYFENAEPDSEYDIVFSIDGLSSLANLGTNTEILVDPAAQVTIESLGTNQFGIRFDGTPNGEIPSGFGIARQEITYPFGSDDTREVSITMSTRPTSAQSLRGNRFAQRIRVNEDGDLTSTRNVLSAATTPGLQAPSYGPQAEIGTSFESSEDRSAALEASRALAEAVGTDMMYPSYQPSTEVQELATRILTDEDFVRQLAQDTTITIEDQSPANYRNVVDSLNEVAGFTLEDADVQYILGRTIPGTFLTLQDSRFEGQRTEQVRNVVETVFRDRMREILNNPRYNRFHDGETLREFTLLEKTQITNYIVSHSLNRIAAVTDNIESLVGVNAYTRLNGRELFTTAALQRMGTGATGFRQFIVGPTTNIEYVEGSITQIDAPLVTDFIYNIYNPILPEFSEGLSREEINSVLESETAINLLSSVHNNVAVLTRLYGTDGLQTLTDLRTQLNEHGSVDLALSEMTGLQQRVARHFLTTVINLRNEWRSHTTENGLITIEPLDGGEPISVGLRIETGTMLVLPCGNLTLFAHQSINTQYEEELFAEEVAAASGRGLIVSDIRNQREERSATIGLPTPRIRRPDEAPEETEEEERTFEAEELEPTATVVPVEPPKVENNPGREGTSGNSNPTSQEAAENHGDSIE